MRTFALALCLLALTACANPADDKPKASVGEAEKPAPTESAAASELYTLTKASRIDWTGSKVTGSHDGGFQKFEGSIQLVGGDPTLSSVEIDIDTTSLYSDSERLTGHLKSEDFFDVAKFPKAAFESTKIATSGDGFEVTGNLLLHGITKSITFPATIELEDKRIRAQAEFSIDRFDFGIEYAGRADDLIRKEVVIRFDLTAERGGPKLNNRI